MQITSEAGSAETAIRVGLGIHFQEQSTLQGSQGSPMDIFIWNAVAPRTQDGGKGPLGLHQAPAPGTSLHHDQLPRRSTTLHQTEHHTAWKPRAAYPHGSIRTWHTSKRALRRQRSRPVTRDIRGCALGRRRMHVNSASRVPTPMTMKFLGSLSGPRELLVKEPPTPWGWRLPLFEELSTLASITCWLQAIRGLIFFSI